jgi:hypothetical protein
MNRLLVPIAVAALLASGCLGYPPGSARPGDTVTIEYTARDPGTGEAIALNRTALFALGSGGSGLGADVEQALVGMRVNETRTVHSPAASRSFDQRRHLNDTVAHGPAVTTVRTATLRQAFGNVSAGYAFAYNQYFNATVESVGDTDTSVRLAPTAGVEEVPDLGVKVRGVALSAEQVALALEPMVGTVFRLPMAIEELGLPAGSYKVLGAEEGRIVYAYSPAALDLVDRDLDVTARLVSIAPGEAPDHGGNYGIRRAPGGIASPQAQPQLADDGHQH